MHFILPILTLLLGGCIFSARDGKWQKEESQGGAYIIRPDLVLLVRTTFERGPDGSGGEGIRNRVGHWDFYDGRGERVDSLSRVWSGGAPAIVQIAAPYLYTAKDGNIYDRLRVVDLSGQVEDFDLETGWARLQYVDSANEFHHFSGARISHAHFDRDLYLNERLGDVRWLFRDAARKRTYGAFPREDGSTVHFVLDTDSGRVSELAAWNGEIEYRYYPNFGNVPLVSGKRMNPGEVEDWSSIEAFLDSLPEGASVDIRSRTYLTRGAGSDICRLHGKALVEFECR